MLNHDTVRAYLLTRYDEDTVTEYMDESEHQDGPETWNKPGQTLEDIAADLDLYIEYSEDDAN